MRLFDYSQVLRTTRRLQMVSVWSTRPLGELADGEAVSNKVGVGAIEISFGPWKREPLKKGLARIITGAIEWGKNNIT